MTKEVYNIILIHHEDVDVSVKTMSNDFVEKENLYFMPDLDNGDLFGMLNAKRITSMASLVSLVTEQEREIKKLKLIIEYGLGPEDLEGSQWKYYD